MQFTERERDVEHLLPGRVGLGPDRAQREEHREQGREEHELAGEPHDRAHRREVGTVHHRRGAGADCRCCCHGVNLRGGHAEREPTPRLVVGERGPGVPPGWAVRGCPGVRTSNDEAPGRFPPMSAAATQAVLRRPAAARPRHRRAPGGRDGRRLAVALYSDKSTTRDKVRRAVGRRPAADLPLVELSEFATLPALLRAVDSRSFDVLVLDGEAAPGRRARRVPPAARRDLRLPARPRAHRPPAGRLARRVVPGRGRRAAPAGPAGRGRRRGHAGPPARATSPPA